MHDTILLDHAGALRRTVSWAAALNLSYFAVEFAVARHIGSVSLFADSIDFLEDAAVNFLIFIALAWTARKKPAVGTVSCILRVRVPPAVPAGPAAMSGRAMSMIAVRLSAGWQAPSGPLMLAA